jgi:ribosome-binding factor A
MRIILSETIQFDVDDPRLAGVTVIDVRIDRELQYANVYVHALGGADSSADVMEGLRSAAGFLRRAVAEELQIRHVPELRFHWDKTLSHAERIDDLLESLDIPPSEGDEDTESGR